MTSELAKALKLEDTELDTYLEEANLNREKFIFAFAPEKAESFTEKEFLNILNHDYDDKSLLHLTDKKFKGNPGRYNVQQIIQVLGEIVKNTHAQEISQVCGLTAAQIKKIRFIFKKGSKNRIRLITFRNNPFAIHSLCGLIF